MIHDPDLLDQLEALGTTPWTGTVWRHMFGARPPSQINDRGARWNPPGVGAIYASLDRPTAIAEGNWAIQLQPYRPRSTRTVYEIELRLENVVDLTDLTVLDDLGIGEAELGGTDHAACQRVGGAVAWLGHDGLLIASARGSGVNLVLYAANHDLAAKFEVVGSTVLAR